MGTIFYPPGWDGPRQDQGPPPAALPSAAPAGFDVLPKGGVAAQPVRPRATRRRAALSRRAVLIAIAGVLIGASAAFAVAENLSARQWRHDERVQASRGALLSQRLSVADSSVTSLQSQVSDLEGHVTRLQSQLSAAANAKERALDTNAIAGTVSEELSNCVEDMQSLIGEIGNDLNSTFYDPYLAANANAAGNACSNAQEANNQLQAILSGAG